MQLDRRGTLRLYRFNDAALVEAALPKNEHIISTG